MITNYRIHPIHQTNFAGSASNFGSLPQPLSSCYVTIPSGPFDEEKPIAPEVKAQIEAHYGLDKPLYLQYFRF